MIRPVWFVAFGLFVAGLVLAALGARFASYRVSTTPDAFGAEQYLQQFEPVEHSSGLAYAWSRPQAALALFGFEGRPLLVTMRLTSPRPTGAAAPVLTLGEGEQLYGSFPIIGDWRSYRVLLPPMAANERTLAFESEGFTPSGRDVRLLGVALSQLRIVGMPPTRWYPSYAERTLFLGLWPLLVFVGLRRLSNRTRLVAWLAAALLPLVALAAALPLSSSYLLPTVWLLPLLPLLPFLAPSLRRGAALVRASQTGSLALGIGLTIATLGLVLLSLTEQHLAAGLLLLAGSLLASLSLRPLSTGWLKGRQTNGHPTGGWFAHRPYAGGHGIGETVILVLILALALVLRLYRLDTLPLGLFRDEARHGMLALQIWNDPTYRPVYVVFGAHLPALLFYLMAPVIGLLGPAAWTARLIPALAGAFTPLALWWLVRPIWGRSVALSAAALLAVATWSLNMSRWAFPVTLDPLFTILALGLLWRSLHTPQPVLRVVLGALAGVCGGLAVYAYHTGRLTPLVLAVATTLVVGPRLVQWRRALPVLAAATLAGLLVLMPLIWFVASDPEGYFYRVERVNLYKDRVVGPHTPLGVTVANLVRYALMWQIEGDSNGRHHLPGAPMLDPASGLLLLLGLLLVVRHPIRGPTLLLLCWLGLSLLPGVFSGQAPHAMRAFDALAPACVLAALGLVALQTSLRQSLAKGGIGLSAAALVTTALVAFSWNTWLTFEARANSRAVYSRFNIVETEVARAMWRVAGDPTLHGYQLLLTRSLAGRDVLQFAAAGLTYGRCDQGRCAPAPAGRALLLLDGESSQAERDEALRSLGPEAQFLGEGPQYPQSNQPIFLAYGVGPEAARAYAVAVGAATTQRTSALDGSPVPSHRQ